MRWMDGIEGWLHACMHLGQEPELKRPACSILVSSQLGLAPGARHHQEHTCAGCGSQADGQRDAEMGVAKTQRGIGNWVDDVSLDVAHGAGPHHVIHHTQRGKGDLHALRENN